MNEKWSPERWAFQITNILNAVLGSEHFPVNVKEVAQEYSHQIFPTDPITVVKGGTLPTFDGALFKAPAGKKGWGIFYNDAINSRGRINFTLGHEFGHYLLHRLMYPNGLRCGQQDLVRWDSDYGQVEHQANVFSANLLMPLDDFRRQIFPAVKPSLNDLIDCAHRYEVSLIASTLRWLSFTSRRSVLVISRDGFILWSKPSEPALRTGAFFRTKNRPPQPVPPGSLAALGTNLDEREATVRELGEGSWFEYEPCMEQAIASEQYDFTISLLHLGDATSLY